MSPAAAGSADRRPTRFAVIVNPTAAGGRATKAVPPARAELERLGTTVRVVASQSLEHAATEAGAAAAAGETVVALGGDGLVGSVAGALRGSDTALAIVPAGRGNDFARVLGIPREPRAAARLAVQGSERLVDVGDVDGAAFVGIASVGIDSEVGRLANDSPPIGGKLVYVYATVRALAGWRHASFEVVADGAHDRVHGFSVAVANSGVFGGGMILVPHARLDDGRLDVLTIGAASRLDYLRTCAKVFSGGHVGHPALRFLTAETVELRADREFTVYADGDPIGALPVTIRVQRQALRVIAPPA